MLLVRLGSCDQSVDRCRARRYLLAAGLLYPGSVSVLTERLSVGVAEEGVLVSVGGKKTQLRGEERRSKNPPGKPCHLA